ncbi:MAG: cytochrome b/b6 domain-containing protein, partial [Burkholderiaceae bacterium]
GAGVIHLRVWDLPIRLFHWSLAISVLGSVASVKLGNMEVHGYCGLFTLSLLIWRLLWGFLGSGPARFTSFVVSPMTTLRYLRSPWLVLGHNPLGAWSVLALLGLVLLQAVTGWGTSDEIAFDGPLVRHLSEQWVSVFGSIHLATEPLLYGLVALHVLAIVYYGRVKKEALLPAMIHGDQVRSEDEARLLAEEKQRPASDDAGLRIKGLVVYLISLALVLTAYYLSL